MFFRSFFTHQFVEHRRVVPASHPGLLVRISPLEERARELAATGHLVCDALADAVHYQLQQNIHLLITFLQKTYIEGML